MYWHDTNTVRFFGGIILSLLSLLGFILGIRRNFKNPSKQLKIIPFYLALIFAQIQTLEFTINESITEINNVPVNKLSLGIFIPLELIFLSSILYNSICSKAIKKFLVIAPSAFAIITPTTWNFFKNDDSFISFISTTESLFLLVPSAFYFYEITTKPPVFQLNKEPSFWTTTGILFLITIITPFSIVFGFIPYEIKQTLDYLGYLILICLFIKALTCSQQAAIQESQLL